MRSFIPTSEDHDILTDHSVNLKHVEKLVQLINFIKRPL